MQNKSGKVKVLQDKRTFIEVDMANLELRIAERLLHEAANDHDMDMFLARCHHNVFDVLTHVCDHLYTFIFERPVSEHIQNRAAWVVAENHRMHVMVNG